MPNTLTTVLIEQVVPAVERLKLDSLVLCDEAGKKAVSSYPPGRLTRREAALLDGEDLPGQIYKYEGHPILELAIAVRGRAELALGGHRYVMSEGDVAIVTPNVPHLERLANRNQGYHLLWLRVSPDRLAMHMSSYSQGNRFQLVRGGSIPRKRTAAYNCHSDGKLPDLSSFHNIEFFIAPTDLSWTLIHTHEDGGLGGPYFVRQDWLVPPTRKHD